MPGCFNVADLSPLAGCSETLEELWMANALSVVSLAPLAACTRLRKLDLRECRSLLLNQVEGLQVACTHLADPQSVKFEGLPGCHHPSLMTLSDDAGFDESAGLYPLHCLQLRSHALVLRIGMGWICMLLGGCH
jgi:hypothetical protein